MLHVYMEMTDICILHVVSKMNYLATVKIFYRCKFISTFMVQEVGRWRGQGRVWLKVKDVKLFTYGALPIHLFTHFCCRVYRLATKHFVTVGPSTPTENKV